MVDPEDARIFDGAMASFTAAGNEAILSGYDFSPLSNIVDGGDGSLISGILKANPAVEGVVFDLSYAIMHARQRLEAVALTTAVKPPQAISSGRCRPAAMRTCSNGSSTVGTTREQSRFSGIADG